MKTLLFNKSWLSCLCVLSVGASVAVAQSNGVPGPEDYSSFSKFITDRNIFDPSRQPHIFDSHRSYVRPKNHPNRAPGIQLVGTMSYDKGMFAFFSGNSEDLSQVLQAGSKIQGYTITEITPDSVALESADKKETSKLKVGDGLREENGKWIFSNAADLPTSEGAAATGTSSSTESTSSTPAASPSTGEPNDVLKRLMQLREKENK